MLSLFDNILTVMTPELERKIPVFISCLKKHSINTPVPSGRIEKGMKITGVQVRTIVRYCRREGYPIGSGGRGYFWIRTEEELELTRKHLTERRNSLDDTLNEMKNIKIQKPVRAVTGYLSNTIRYQNG